MRIEFTAQLKVSPLARSVDSLFVVKKKYISPQTQLGGSDVAAYKNSLLIVTISLVKQKVRFSVRSVDIEHLRIQHNMWNDHLEEWQSKERKGNYNDCK